jgi:hypothetical protein
MSAAPPIARLTNPSDAWVSGAELYLVFVPSSARQDLGLRTGHQVEDASPA